MLIVVCQGQICQKRKKAIRAPKSVGYKLLPNEQGAQFAWIQSAEHNFPRTTNWILINSSFIYYSYASFPFKIQVYARRSRKYFGTLTQRVSFQELGEPVYFNPGWQKLCEGTKGLRRKVWTRTKICYILHICNYAQNRRICRENSIYAPGEKLK